MLKRLSLVALLLLAGPRAAMATSAPGAGSGPTASASALHVDWLVDGAVTGAALAGWGALELARNELVPPTCRWCAPPGIDADARRALAWSGTGTPRAASDVLLVAIPAGFAAYDLLATREAGLGAAAEDVLVVAEAVALTGLLTDVSKYSFARQRPYARALPAGGDAENRVSFWSGHTSVAFAAAAAGGSVARLRDYPGWGWVYGIGFGAATATGYFRLAADEHWLTDVLAGAAAGSAIGFLVPWLHRGGAATGISVLVLPDRVVLAGAL